MEHQEDKFTQDNPAGVGEQPELESDEGDEDPISFEIEQISQDGSLYSALDVDRSQIRLVYINPEPCGQACGEDDSAICCDLFKVSLDDEPGYAALSYVWGNPKDTTDICLGGRIMPVTKNLANALKRLREVPQEYFWADAICINQGDVDERGQQVQLMEDIYSCADFVYAWLSAERMPLVKPEQETLSDKIVKHLAPSRPLLASTWPSEVGESERSSALSKSVRALDLAMNPPLPFEGYPEGGTSDNCTDGMGEEEVKEEDDDEKASRPELVEVPAKMRESEVDTGLFWCNMIFEQLEANNIQATETAKDTRKIRRSDDMHVLANDAIYPVLDLLENKYWSRVWIFQEMVLADELTFLGPNTSLELSRFQAVCSWLQEIGDGDVLGPSFVDHKVWSKWKEKIQLAEMMPLKVKRCKAHVEKIDRSKPKASQANAREEVFEMTRYLQATDPRDHVYGIVGVLDVRFKPDYKRSVEDVYTAWACWLALARPDLRFLNQAGFGQNKEHGYDLPSWVPDWSSTWNLRYGNSSVYANDQLKGQFGFQKKELGFIRKKKRTILIADGVEVSEVAPRRSDGKGMFLKMYNHLLSNGHPTGDPPLQVLFRTLTSDNTNADACRKGKFDHHNPKLLRQFIAFASLLMNSDDDAFHLLDKDPLAWNPVSWAINEYFGLPPRPANSREDRWNPLDGLYNDKEDFLSKGPDTGDPIVNEMLKEVLDVSFDTFELLGGDDYFMSIELEGTSLFRTLDGYVGSSGTDVRAGDNVCVLVGCRNPLILRPVKDHFVLVEPAFIHGLMYGQVSQGLSEGRYKMRKFEIH